MTTKELLDQIYNMESANPFTEDTYVSLNFDTNYTGSFHKCLMRGGYFVLDGSFDPEAGYVELETLIGMLEIAPDVEVAYYVPSMGLYVAESAKRRIGDWGDGDGEYDMIAIKFTEEPVQVKESTNTRKGRRMRRSTIESKVMGGIKRGKLRESGQFTDPDYPEMIEDEKKMGDMLNMEMDAGWFDD